MEQSLFVTGQRVYKIKEATADDPVMQTLAGIMMKGWSYDKKDVPMCVQEYWPYRDELTPQYGIIYRGTRVIIPVEMRSQMLERAHASHLKRTIYPLHCSRNYLLAPNAQPADSHCERVQYMSR